MNNTKEEVVLYTDPTAASLKTFTGWVSRDGRFWGKDEAAARYSGCTHKICECGNLMKRFYTKCDQCISKLELERYNNLPFKEWDGKSPVYSDAYDKYFFEYDDISDYCEEENIDPVDLRLVLCVPNKYYHVRSDYWEDIMPEDSGGDLPKALQEALNNLHKVIDNLPPASWCPGKVRTNYSETV